MTRPPEPSSDVVCQQCRHQDGRDTWTIWLAGDKQADRDTLTDAIELARHVAVTHGRPAWLLDETGYPLKPMLPWAL